MKIKITTIALAIGLVMSSSSVYASDVSLRNMITEIAQQHGIPPALAHSVVKAESTYKCNARSRDGALGIMQVMPRTARSVGVTGNLQDCRTGLEAGMRYLERAIDKHGVTCEGISAYNTGRMDRPTCTSYGRKILKMMKKFDDV